MITRLGHQNQKPAGTGYPAFARHCLQPPGLLPFLLRHLLQSGSTTPSGKGGKIFNHTPASALASPSPCLWPQPQAAQQASPLL